MRAVEYLRYSSSSQTEQSIEGQQEDCDRFADAQNIEIVGRYIDRAERGSSDERDAFQQMMRDAKKGRFDLVLVWKYDRFSRDEYHSLMYENRLSDCGVKLVSVMEPVPDGAVGTATKGMLRVIAQFYTDDLREKVLRGMRKTAEKGNYPGGYLPLGYMAVGGKRERKIAIDPATAPYAVKAFQMYADGVGKKEIADTLTLMGARSRDGGPFKMRGLSHMFTNEKYIGVYSYGGQHRQEGVVPALIDRATWDKVQARIKAAERAPSVNKAQTEYLLSMKLYCGLCGALMAGECGTSKSGAVHNYYKCSTRKRFKTCHKESVRKDAIERFIAQEVRARLTDDFIVDLSAEIVRQSREHADAGRGPDAIQADIKRQEKVIGNVVAAIAAAGHSEALISALSAAEDEKKRLLRELDFSREVRAATADVETVVAFLKQFQGGSIDDPEWMRAVFEIFIGRIYLFNDKARIYFNTSEKPVDVYFSAGCSDLPPDAAPA